MLKLLQNYDFKLNMTIVQFSNLGFVYQDFTLSVQSSSLMLEHAIGKHTNGYVPVQISFRHKCFSKNSYTHV